MSQDRSPTPEVAAMLELTITGNVIPPTWSQHLRYENGRVNANALLILSDIVYWYRPKSVRDEKTGEFLRYERRFAGDYLQRSYDAFGEQWGLSKKQARDAVNFLADAGIITKHLRTIQTASGPIFQVLFLQLHVEALKILNAPKSSGVTYKSPRMPVQVTPDAAQVGTYTEITPEISPEKTEVVVEAKKAEKPKSDPFQMGQAVKGDDLVALKLARADSEAERVAVLIHATDPTTWHLVALLRKKARPDTTTFCAWLPTVADQLETLGADAINKALTVTLQRTQLGDPFSFFLGVLRQGGKALKQKPERGASDSFRRGAAETEAPLDEGEEFDMAEILKNAPLDGSWGGRKR